MPLWRREGFVEDTWAFLGDEAPVPEEGAIVVSLKRWLEGRETLSARELCGMGLLAIGVLGVTLSL